MGIGNSQEWFGQRKRKRSSSPRAGLLGKRNYRRGNFRRRRSPSPTIQPSLPDFTLPVSYQPLYGSYPGNRPFPTYIPLQPMSSPFLPISYNNYPVPSNMPPQYMMMQPQRMAPPMPVPYMGLPPPMSTPYGQQAQMQPVYNNIGVPASMPGGTGFYPPSYPSAPARLITDWTGGGQISPGFLGPPI